MGGSYVFENRDWGVGLEKAPAIMRKALVFA